MSSDLAKSIGEMHDKEIKKLMDKMGINQDLAKFYTGIAFAIMAWQMNRWPYEDQMMTDAIKQYEEHFKEKMPDDVFVQVALAFFPYAIATEKENR